MTQKNTNPWTFDVRVRERNIKSGAVSEKDIDAYLAQLPDLESQSESFSLSQPALEGEDDDDFEVEAAPVAAAPVAAAPVAPVAAAPVAAPAPAVAPVDPEPAAPSTDVASEPGT